MTLIRFKASQEQDVDLSRTYDAVVVGSGAAGGMAAHVLTSQGCRSYCSRPAKKFPSSRSYARWSGPTITRAAASFLPATTAPL